MINEKKTFRSVNQLPTWFPPDLIQLLLLLADIVITQVSKGGAADLKVEHSKQ